MFLRYVAKRLANIEGPEDATGQLKLSRVTLSPRVTRFATRLDERPLRRQKKRAIAPSPLLAPENGRGETENGCGGVREERRLRGVYFIFLVYRNNCETRHPRGGHPAVAATRSIVRARSLAKSPKRPFIVGATARPSTYTASSCCALAGSSAALRAGRDRSEEEMKKRTEERNEEEEERRSFIMELRNCKLSKYKWARGTRRP